MTLENLKLSDYGFSVLQIETKSNCNMACKFCPYPIREDNKSVMLESDVFNLIDQINPNDSTFEYVCFSQYNEPLLDSNIFKYIQYANSKKIRNLLITNALLLNNKSKRDQIIQASPTFLKISLQTINKKKFNWSRGTNLDVQDYFERIYKLLSEIKEKKTKVSVDLACNFISPKKKILKKVLGLSTGDFSVPDSTKQITNDLINFIKGLSNFDNYFKVDEEKIKSFLINSTNYYVQEVGLELAPNIFIKIKPFIHGRRISEFKPLINSFSCEERILGILADGSLMPCCKTYNNDLSLGNIKKNSIMEILKKNDKWINDLRSKNKTKDEICKKCYGEPSIRGTFFRAALEQFRR
jgi:radical SAM protein with 4Fe4S-binding SPASM domain